MIGLATLTGLWWDRCPCAYLGDPLAISVWQWVVADLPVSDDDTYEWIHLVRLARCILAQRTKDSNGRSTSQS